MKLRQRICARRGTAVVQHQTKVFYFVTLKFAGHPDHHILIDYGYHTLEVKLSLSNFSPKSNLELIQIPCEYGKNNVIKYFVYL